MTKSKQRYPLNRMIIRVEFVLLLMFAGMSCRGNPTLEEEESFVELLPSDVPITMMERITKDKGQKAIEKVTLTTSLGTITGLRQPTMPPHYDNDHMHSFRGIPFAKAPVGSLRFADPVDQVEGWPGNHLNATRCRSFCPQFDVESKTILGAEDCLFLNVYTPAHLGEEKRKDGKLLPVFVFIHGGGYIRGSSSAHGAEKLLSRDVVVVTFNYRLGALGFLSTSDSHLPGNYGLLDQVSALRWVQRNIAEFGGDPQQVTLGGFSVGSVFTNLHMYSPLSKNLFHRGIMMSGSVDCTWSLRNDSLIPAKMLAEKLDCPTTPKDLASCISGKTVNQIVTAQAAIYKYEFIPMWLTPVLDGGLRSSPFFPVPLEEMVLRPVPTIVGHVPHEGLLFTAGILLLSENPRNASSVYEETIRSIISPWPYPETEETMKDLAEAFYYNQNAKTSRRALLEQMVEFTTDFAFAMGIWKTAINLATAGAPVYSYLMTHRDPETPTWASPLYQKLKDLGYDSSLLQQGISHGDDVIHLFNFPYGLKKGSERDQRVNQIILSMVTNFIISGSPQQNMERYSLGDLPEWKRNEPNNPDAYYDISVHPHMVYTSYKLKERNFWYNVVPRSRNISSKGIKDTEDCCSRNDLMINEEKLSVMSDLNHSCVTSSLDSCSR